MMTDTEIEGYLKKLNDLTARCTDEHPEDHIHKEFLKLAREVGASTRVLVDRRILDANTSELIKNIHQALQTATMVNMCSAATKGYEIATNASNMAAKASRSASIQFWIATIIAFVSAVAAWLAALRSSI